MVGWLLPFGSLAPLITGPSYHGSQAAECLAPVLPTFANLSGDATLIVPSPRTSEDAYGHFASFLRKAPVMQINTMWQKIGDVVLGTISDRPLWLSTAGGGVAWLHVRLDSSPKYYGYAPYRNAR